MTSHDPARRHGARLWPPPADAARRRCGTSADGEERRGQRHHHRHHPTPALEQGPRGPQLRRARRRSSRRPTPTSRWRLRSYTWAGAHVRGRARAAARCPTSSRSRSPTGAGPHRARADRRHRELVAELLVRGSASTPTSPQAGQADDGNHVGRSPIAPRTAIGACTTTAPSSRQARLDPDTPPTTWDEVARGRQARSRRRPARPATPA